MEIHLAGSRPTRRAPKENFTGTVWQDPIIMTPQRRRICCSRVSFEPGARTAWHTHPLGQTLYVISGVGRLPDQGRPGPRNPAGDVVWIPPGEKHWHGGFADQRHDPYRDAGSARWQSIRPGWST
jgi:quercetin dioxygenase-like cupin family protein